MGARGLKATASRHSSTRDAAPSRGSAVGPAPSLSKEPDAQRWRCVPLVPHAEKHALGEAQGSSRSVLEAEECVRQRTCPAAGFRGGVLGSGSHCTMDSRVVRGGTTPRRTVASGRRDMI